MKSSLLLFTFSAFISLIAAASSPLEIEVVHALPQGRFSVGIGSEIQLSKNGKNLRPGLFLGRLIEPNGKLSSFMFYDTAANTVMYVDKDSIEVKDRGFQDVLDLYEQQGGTCTAYAMYDFLQQMNLAGFAGNKALNKTLADEQGRTQLLVDIVNQYYLEPQHQFSTTGILNGFGKKFDFKCKKKSFNDIDSIREFFQTQLETGMPVLIGFNVGPDMFNPSFKMLDYDHPKDKVDKRLWIPRQRGQRESGGHSVAAVAAFTLKGHLALVMLDSDWDRPRVWEFDRVFTAKTALDEIEFDICE